MSSSGGRSLKQAFRRLAAPVLAPVDGRVADINRRIGHARAATEQVAGALELQLAAVSESVAAVEARLAELSARIEQMDTVLGRYVVASAEASTFVGVELRRVEQSLHTLAEELHRAPGAE